MKMWICRSKRGTLSLFTEKPIKDRYGRWFGEGDSVCKFDMPEVTFENSPMEVELVIKNVCSKS